MMIDIFPPRTERISEIHLMLALLDCLIPNRSAVYASAPVTSGRRYYESLKNLGTNERDAEFIKQIVQLNRNDAVLFVQSLRERFPIVIDPTILRDITDWSQEEYRVLWSEVIEKYVNKAVFIYEWEYSNGCCFEFLCAKRVGVETMDHDMNPLSLRQASRLIQSALGNLNIESHSAFRRSVLHELKKLCDKPK